MARAASSQADQNRSSQPDQGGEPWNSRPIVSGRWEAPGSLAPRSGFARLAGSEFLEIGFDNLAVLGRHLTRETLQGLGTLFFWQLAPILGNLLQLLGI